jgi:hypothetical protein
LHYNVPPFFQARDNVPMSRVLGPLPENAFAAAARESIPEPAIRVTTASIRGNLRGRGRGRSCATREPAKSKELAGEVGSSRGRGRSCSTREPTKRKELAREVGSSKGRGTTKRKTIVEAATSDAQEQSKTNRGGYNTGQGSIYYMLFGDDVQQPRPTAVPDLNDEVLPDLNVQEFALSQNAPAHDDPE